MTDYWTGILGGLIGSIFTIVLSKLLEIFQKSKEHKYTLEKFFFEKKLIAAEAAINQYTVLSAALTNTSLLYERLNNDITYLEESLQKSILEQISGQLELANQAFNNAANSISLYFDIDVMITNNTVMRNLYTLLAEIHPITEIRDSTFEKYRDSIGTETEIVNYQSYVKSENDLNQLSLTISNSYQEFNNQLLLVIRQIRNEMKKFEY